jgi:acyl-CoA thioesterase FadM
LCIALSTLARVSLYPHLPRGSRQGEGFVYRVTRDEEVLAVGHTIHACITREGNIREFPEALSSQLYK